MRKPNASDQGHLLMAYGMPPLYELARHGKIWTLMVGNGATFKAPLVAIPAIATAATWLLLNGAAVGSKSCLIILKTFAFLTGGTTAAGLALALQVPKGAQTTFSSSYSGVTESNTIGSTDSSGAYLGNAKTMIGAQAAWDLYWNGDNAATATILGSGITVNHNGEYIIKPQHGLALEVISGAGTTPLFGVGIQFAKVDCDVS